MQKLYAILIAVAMTAMFTPSVSAASYTDSAAYDIPSGPNGNRVPLPTGGSVGTGAFSTRPCAPEWDEFFTEGRDNFITSGNESLGIPGDGLGFIAKEINDVTTRLVCSTGRELRWGSSDADEGVVNMGVFSRAIQAEEDLYTDFIWTVTDSAFDSTYFTGCIITDNGDSDDNSCGEGTDPVTGEPTGEPDFPTNGCGTATVNTEGELSGRDNRVATFIYASFVDADTLESCFGSSGELTVVMSS